MSNDAIDTAASLPSIAPSIAVVIPAYKAERHIRSVIARIPDFVEHIVVVDDGSPDGTAAIVKEMVDRRVILVSHPDNRGVGAAVLSGYCAAVAVGSTIVVKIDADDQMDPAYLRSLITPICLHRADYAKG